jgi:hypothetical protein
MMNRLSVLKKPKKNLILPVLLVIILGLLFLASANGPVTGYINQDDNESETSHPEDETKTEDEEDESSDTDDDGVEEEEEETNERELDIDAKDEEVKIESHLKLGEKKDEIHLEFKVIDEPEIKLEYESESGSTEIELEFKIRFYSLIEYNDEDLNGMFNESQDELVQEIRLDSVEYSPIQYTIETTDTSTSLHIINVTTSDGLFSLQSYLANEFAVVDGALITPTEMKIDIGINNFPYMSNSSMLALKLRLEAEKEYDFDEETEDENEGRSNNEEEVEVTMNGFTGFFSWSENAIVDGAIQSVKASQVNDDDMDPTEQKIYLNYPRGSKILHDPKIGVESILQVSGVSSVPGFLSPIALLALAILSGLIVIYRKRR